MSKLFRAILFAVAMCFCPPIFAEPGETYNYDEKPWAEAETAIPAFPKPADLIEFYVGPTESNHFFVDAASISIGTDGVVRYVLVVKTLGGATNVSFEGIRCGTRELKLYATGRSDGTWNKVVAPRWRQIENKLVNQHHAVLNRDFLCPSEQAPGSAAEVRNALRAGKRMEAP